MCLVRNKEIVHLEISNSLRQTNDSAFGDKKTPIGKESQQLQCMWVPEFAFIFRNVSRHYVIVEFCEVRKREFGLCITCETLEKQFHELAASIESIQRILDLSGHLRRIKAASTLEVTRKRSLLEVKGWLKVAPFQV